MIQGVLVMLPASVPHQPTRLDRGDAARFARMFLGASWYRSFRTLSIHHFGSSNLCMLCLGVTQHASYGSQRIRTVLTLLASGTCLTMKQLSEKFAVFISHFHRFQGSVSRWLARMDNDRRNAAICLWHKRHFALF